MTTFKSLLLTGNLTAICKHPQFWLCDVSLGELCVDDTWKSGRGCGGPHHMRHAETCCPNPL